MRACVATCSYELKEARSEPVGGAPRFAARLPPSHCPLPSDPP